MKQEKQFIRDVEDALVETAKEADRQRSFKEREAETLKHRLQSNKLEADLTINRRLQDNSSLLFECNELRKYVRRYLRFDLMEFDIYMYCYLFVLFPVEATKN